MKFLMCSPTPIVVRTCSTAVRASVRSASVGDRDSRTSMRFLTCSASPLAATTCITAVRASARSASVRSNIGNTKTLLGYSGSSLLVSVQHYCPSLQSLRVAGRQGEQDSDEFCDQPGVGNGGQGLQHCRPGLRPAQHRWMPRTAWRPQEVRQIGLGVYRWALIPAEPRRGLES
jgi:hypothetical protein